MRFPFVKNGWIAARPFLAFLLLVGLTVGCSKGIKKAEDVPGEEWIADMRERIDDSIADPGKKAQMMLMVDQMEAGIIKLDQTIRKHYSDLFEIDRNYDALPEDFRKQFADFNRARYKIRNHMIESRTQLKDLTTPEEWEKLTDISKKKDLFRKLIQYPDLNNFSN